MQDKNVLVMTHILPGSGDRVPMTQAIAREIELARSQGRHINIYRVLRVNEVKDVFPEIQKIYDNFDPQETALKRKKSSITKAIKHAEGKIKSAKHRVEQVKIDKAKDIEKASGDLEKLQKATSKYERMIHNLEKRLAADERIIAEYQARLVEIEKAMSDLIEDKLGAISDIFPICLQNLEDDLDRMLARQLGCVFTSEDKTIQTEEAREFIAQLKDVTLTSGSLRIWDPNEQFDQRNPIVAGRKRDVTLRSLLRQLLGKDAGSKELHKVILTPSLHHMLSEGVDGQSDSSKLVNILKTVDECFKLDSEELDISLYTEHGSAEEVNRLNKTTPKLEVEAELSEALLGKDTNKPQKVEISKELPEGTVYKTDEHSYVMVAECESEGDKYSVRTLPFTCFATGIWWGNAPEAAAAMPEVTYTAPCFPPRQVAYWKGFYGIEPAQVDLETFSVMSYIPAASEMEDQQFFDSDIEIALQDEETLRYIHSLGYQRVVCDQYGWKHEEIVGEEKDFESMAVQLNSRGPIPNDKFISEFKAHSFYFSSGDYSSLESMLCGYEGAYLHCARSRKEAQDRAFNRPMREAIPEMDGYLCYSSEKGNVDSRQSRKKAVTESLKFGATYRVYQAGKDRLKASLERIGIVGDAQDAKISACEKFKAYSEHLASSIRASVFCQDIEKADGADDAVLVQIREELPKAAPAPVAAADLLPITPVALAQAGKASYHAQEAIFQPA